jgi:phosphate regulon transcriptional regulator PhoB
VTKPALLLVEDDRALADLLMWHFDREGYEIVRTADGDEALLLAEERTPDLVILDWMIEGVSGIEVCRRLRRRPATAHVPIIMLTARGEESDRIRGLETGADDYVTKPFSPRELMARVQAAIRRRKRPTQSAVYRFGECEVDFEKMTAKRAGVLVVLTSHEFKLLRFFTENPERVLSRELLLNEVWGYNSYPTTRTVDNQILKLRQKLEPDPANPTHLLTIYGAGYKFVP